MPWRRKSTGAEAASCILTPEQTEGPYDIDDEPFRKNVAEGRPGTRWCLCCAS